MSKNFVKLFLLFLITCSLSSIPVLKIAYSLNSIDKFYAKPEIETYYEFGNDFIETNSICIDKDQLFFSIAELSHRGKGGLGKINLKSNDLEWIIKTDDERFTHWTCLKHEEIIFWFGQWTNKNYDTVPSDIIKYDLVSMEVHFERLENTNDCNEFVSSEYFNNSIYVGERIKGGTSRLSDFPNGGGLWKYDGKFKRIWENPKNLEVYSIKQYKNHLYLFLSTTVQSDYMYSEIWRYDGKSFTKINGYNGTDISFNGGAVLYKDNLIIGGYNSKYEGVIVYTKDGNNYNVLDKILDNNRVYSFSDMIENPYTGNLLITANTYINDISIGEKEGTYLILSTEDLINYNVISKEKNGLVLGHHGSALQVYRGYLYISSIHNGYGCSIDRLDIPISIKNIYFKDNINNPLSNLKINNTLTDSKGRIFIALNNNSNLFKFIVPESYKIHCIYYVKFTIENYSLINLNLDEEALVIMDNKTYDVPIISNSTIDILDYNYNNTLVNVILDSSKNASDNLTIVFSEFLPKDYKVFCNSSKWEITTGNKYITIIGLFPEKSKISIYLNNKKIIYENSISKIILFFLTIFSIVLLGNIGIKKRGEKDEN
jgi:hypothetical protein